MTVFSSFARITLEDISPHFSTNTEIIWDVPTNALPKSFWVYKKLPHIFSATTISNAVVLASFQSKGFPAPSTNQIVIWADSTAGEPQPPDFAIMPATGELSYSLGDRAPDSAEAYFKDKATVARAWDCLGQLGVDRTEFVKTNVAPEGDWGVFLPRQIDGILFFDESEGFSYQQFGHPARIRTFALALPDLERTRDSLTATPQQIIACIRAHKAPIVPPQNEEFDLFKRVKELSKATKFTITKITPYYGEGVYGDTPTNNEIPEIAYPIAVLEGAADFGNSNLTVQLVTPILSSEVMRLLRK
jgi:hypothetical protein